MRQRIIWNCIQGIRLIQQQQTRSHEEDETNTGIGRRDSLLCPSRDTTDEKIRP